MKRTTLRLLTAAAFAAFFSVPANAAGLPTVTPHQAGFAAEIGAIDLRQPVSDAAFELIHEAFLRHKVLIFRGQPLDDDAHQAFALRFGPLEGLSDGHRTLRILAVDGLPIEQRNLASRGS